MKQVKKIPHYNLDKIDSLNADYNIIYGERSNGKSYQVKHKKAVEKYLETGKRFILMRRWKEEITSEKIESYFGDVDVEKLTNGKYNCVYMWRKTLYLANYDIETGKTIKGEKIGYVVALSTEQNYAGASYLDVEDIIFEEFMSRGIYIANEPDKLMNFYCTVDRKRHKTKIWLVGNSISRVCPYINEWGLSKIFSRQKQGTIEELKIPTGEYNTDGTEEIVKIAIEYCASTGISSHTIGNHSAMLNTGSWQSDPQPHLPKSIKEYKILYKIGFQYQDFRFIAEYIQDKETFDFAWFVFPHDKDFSKNKNKLLIFTDVINTSPYFQRDIYNPSINNDNLRRLLQTFKENKIFYSSDLCGTDFKQVIDFEIRK